MFDLKLIRQDPDAFDKGLARRGLEPQAQEILALDEKRRSAMTKEQETKAELNAVSKSIGQLMGAGKRDEAEEAKARAASFKSELETLGDEARELNEEIESLLLTIPNLPHEGTPDGENEAANVEVRKAGSLPDFSFQPREHFDLGEMLGQMDFERAAKMSGARFVVLKGGLARLERALGQFMLDMHVQNHDYEEVVTPTLVRDRALVGTGQLPKFKEDLFKTEGDHWLIPTAEVTLTNLNRESILDEETLPLRYTALTQCFRAEAGAAGRDTRGMIRQHQFAKVELVSVVRPEESEQELERMTGAAESVLKALELPYRVMALCTGDMGFSAQKTYDIEVWLPGQNQYREISSCSMCGDFQARRMNMRARKSGEKETRFVHTLNGSGVAVGRALVAVIENYQQADGSIRVPDVLQPYMGGLSVIK